MNPEELFIRAQKIRRENNMTNDNPRLINWIRVNTNDQARSMDDLATLSQRAGNARDQEQVKSNRFDQIALNALQGITFGFGDELVGGAVGILSPNLTRQEGIEAARTGIAQSREDAPVVSFLAELGGGLLVPGGLGAKGVARGSTLGRQAGRAAGIGAVEGGLFGLGEGEGGIVERAPGAALPAAIGLAGGGLFGGAGALTQRVRRRPTAAAQAGSVLEEGVTRGGVRQSTDVLDDLAQRRSIDPTTRAAEIPEFRETAQALTQVSPDARRLGREFAEETEEVVRKQAARRLRQVDAPDAGDVRQRILNQKEDLKNVTEDLRTQRRVTEFERTPKQKKARRARGEATGLTPEQKADLREVSGAITRQSDALRSGSNFVSGSVNEAAVREAIQVGGPEIEAAFRAGAVEKLQRMARRSPAEVTALFTSADDELTGKLALALGPDFDAIQGMFRRLDDRITTAKLLDKGTGQDVGAIVRGLEEQQVGAVRGIMNWLGSALSFNPTIASLRAAAGFAKDRSQAVARSRTDEVVKLLERALLEGDDALLKGLLDPATLAARTSGLLEEGIGLAGVTALPGLLGEQTTR